MGKLREMTLWVHEKGVKKKGKKEKKNGRSVRNLQSVIKEQRKQANANANE